MLQFIAEYFDQEKFDKDRLRNAKEITVVLSGGIGDAVEQARVAAALCGLFPDKKINVFTGEHPSSIFDFSQLSHQDVHIQQGLQSSSDNSVTFAFLSRANVQLKTFHSQPRMNAFGVAKFFGGEPVDVRLHELTRTYLLQVEDFDPDANLSARAKYVVRPANHQIQQMFFSLSRLSGQHLNPTEFLGNSGVRIPEFPEEKEFDVVIFYDSKTGGGIKNLSSQQLYETIDSLLKENPNLRVAVAVGTSNPDTALLLAREFPQLSLIRDKSLFNVIEKGCSSKVVVTVDSVSAHYLGNIRRQWLQTHSREEVFELIEVMGFQAGFEPTEFHADMLSELIVADKKASKK